MKNLAIFAITLYQKLLSPRTGLARAIWQSPQLNLGIGTTGCLNKPNCSEFAKTIIAKKGFIAGGWLAVKQILTCHPFGRKNVKTHDL